ncbi:hypothetical protein IAU60_005785 [Kwoniella sp. DSM 27419]
MQSYLPTTRAHDRRASPYDRPASAVPYRQNPHAFFAHPVDSYRPEDVPMLPRTAEQVYHDEREKAMTKSDRIFSKLTEISSSIASMQEDLSLIKHDVAGGRDDVRHLRDKMHELQQGQRVLATREEVIEEIIQQVAPLITDQLNAYTDKLDRIASGIPDRVVTSAYAQLNNFGRELSRSTASSLDTLKADLHCYIASHTVGKLDALDKLQEFLVVYKDLPEALAQIHAFAGLVQTLGEKAEQAERANPPVSNDVSTSERDDLFDRIQQMMQAEISKADGAFSRSFSQQLCQTVQGIHQEYCEIKQLLQGFLFRPISTPSAPTCLRTPASDAAPAPGGLPLLSHTAPRSSLEAYSTSALPPTPSSGRPVRICEPVKSLGNHHLVSALSNAPITSKEDVFGPLMGVSAGPQIAPLSAEFNIDTEPLLSASTARTSRVTSKARKKVRKASPPISRAPQTAARSSQNKLPVKGDMPGVPRASPLSIFDRPHTRSMSSTVPRTRYTMSGHTKETPIEFDSGSSGSPNARSLDARPDISQTQVDNGYVDEGSPIADH